MTFGPIMRHCAPCWHKSRAVCQPQTDIDDCADISYHRHNRSKINSKAASHKADSKVNVRKPTQYGRKLVRNTEKNSNRNTRELMRRKQHIAHNNFWLHDDMWDGFRPWACFLAVMHIGNFTPTILHPLHIKAITPPFSRRIRKTFRCAAITDRCLCCWVISIVMGAERRKKNLHLHGKQMMMVMSPQTYHIQPPRSEKFPFRRTKRACERLVMA